MYGFNKIDIDKSRICISDPKVRVNAFWYGKELTAALIDALHNYVIII